MRQLRVVENASGIDRPDDRGRKENHEDDSNETDRKADQDPAETTPPAGTAAVSVFVHGGPSAVRMTPTDPPHILFRLPPYFANSLIRMFRHRTTSGSVFLPTPCTWNPMRPSASRSSVMSATATPLTHVRMRLPLHSIL